MNRKQYDISQKKRASTLMALGSSELTASEKLIDTRLYREASVHLYFTCFHVSWAILCDSLGSLPSDKYLNAHLRKVYGRNPEFPKQYLDLHTALYRQCNEFAYRTPHTPDPEDLRKQFSQVQAYVKFAMTVVPRAEMFDFLQGIIEDNKDKIKEFSFDVYDPNTYIYHPRLTFWLPRPYSERLFKNVCKQGQHMLQLLRVDNYEEYVVGLNSKVSQYQDDHLVLLDIDAISPGVEAALKPFGGILLKSGRGFHFIGKKIISGRTEWRMEVKRLLKNKCMKNYIDEFHLNISLMRGYSTLRITASPLKPTVPYFYKEI